MVDWQLIKCAFGKHNLSEPINDSYHGWIMVCKKCGHIKHAKLCDIIKYRDSLYKT